MINAHEESRKLVENILKRLKRIEGQIRGIHGMVSAGKHCEDILIQVKAVQAALHSVTKLILKNYLLKCYQRGNSINGSSDELWRELEEVITLLSKFL